MSEIYAVPAATQRTETEVAGSRFIATVARVETTDEARAFLAQIRAEMPDATHHVYAFRVGYGSSTIEGMSDDGEPSGTAGPPTLAVLRGTKIGDVIIVITRYFGGRKLGTGGLVRAYSESAHTAFNALTTELKIHRLTLGVELAYSFYQPVRRLIEQHEGTIQEETFTDKVAVIVEFPEQVVAAFTDDLRELTAGQVAPVRLD